MPKSLRVGIIGAGHFGYFHAQKSDAHPLEHLVGIYDLDFQKADSVAKIFGVSVYEEERELLEKVEAVIIATPASTHFELAARALSMGKHVFLEKPLAVTKEAGQELVLLSQKMRKILQVGHLVTFSLSPQRILEIIPNPRKITMRRSVPFSHRGCDVSVVLDLMIHDLEFLFSLMGEKAECLEAYGEKFQTEHVDEAMAKFLFANRCRVDLFASRAALKPERLFRIEGETDALEVNFITHTFLHFKNGHSSQKILWKKKDLLWEEHDDFVKSCLFKKETASSLDSAYQALCMANLLEEKIQKSA